MFGQAAAAILCLIFPKRGKWFHLPSIAAGLLVLGLSLFLARHQVKKRRLRESQWRSDQVEMLLQEMDEALWNEQENAGLHLGGRNSEAVDAEEQLIQGISGIFRVQ